MAVARENEVDWVGLKLGVIFRVMTQENLVAREFAEAGQKLCVYLPGDLLGGYPSEQYILDFHAAVIQQHNIRILEDRFIFVRQIQIMVAQAHHHRGYLRCFHEKIIRILFAVAVLLSPSQSSQTVGDVDDMAKHTGNQAVILFNGAVDLPHST